MILLHRQETTIASSASAYEYKKMLYKISLAPLRLSVENQILILSTLNGVPSTGVPSNSRAAR